LTISLTLMHKLTIKLTRAPAYLFKPSCLASFFYIKSNAQCINASLGQLSHFWDWFVSDIFNIWPFRKYCNTNYLIALLSYHVIFCRNNICQSQWCLHAVTCGVNRLDGYLNDFIRFDKQRHCSVMTATRSTRSVR